MEWGFTGVLGSSKDDFAGKQRLPLVKDLTNTLSLSHTLQYLPLVCDTCALVQKQLLASYPLVCAFYTTS